MTTLAEGIGGAKRVIGGPFGSKLTSADYVLEGVPVIRGSNMEQGGRWIGGAFAFVAGEKVTADLSSNLARRGDIIVTQRGTLGQVSIVPDDADAERFVVSQSQMAISVDPTKASRDFVYYYLRSPLFADYLGQSTIQTGVPHINLGILRQAPASWPELAVQQRIAERLVLLDDKIELNRRMNETLEAMAQAIFRDWFVDFGPVRRKMEGATDPVAIMGGLTPDPARAAELAALFPAALDENGLPVGWSERPIGDQVEIVGGSTPSTADERLWTPAEHRWATPKDLSGMDDLALFETGRRISDAGVAKITSGLLPAGTVLLSSRAPIGYLAIAQEPVAINQGFIALKPTADLGSAYLYLWCKANMEAILANANGSTFQEISKKNFRPITSAVPNDLALVRAFGYIVQPLIDRVVSAALENRTLTETRDYLLPRLMSGQVRVGEISTQEVAA